jgi:non-specific serine/threonine protein kinase
MIGTVFQNRYRLESELGQGGMGVVYRAHDTLLDRPVAIKMLTRPGLGSESRARLLREARAVASLNHPNIVSVYDAGQTEGVSFIIMELVEGGTLPGDGSKTIQEIVDIARQVCVALEHAHAHGIVHRDLKPENVLITPDGSPKLMDFGLARSPIASRLTSEETIIGTVYYLAPEQALGREVDGRTDLYSLGVMLYELITGRLPFEGDDPLAVISQHLHAPVESPRTYRPDLPPALEAIILKLLAKEPANRYASAQEVGLALSGFAGAGVPEATNRIPNNLPVQLSSFIGRKDEIAEVRQLLANARLVTLTGAGGSGKTRLASQVARELLENYPDGVWLIELAALSDPALVTQAAASILQVREQSNRSLSETLADFIHSRKMLIVLDNCEHLIGACANLAESLLSSCSNLRILVTSREAIGITGEIAWSVPTLSSPDPQQLQGPFASPNSELAEPLVLELMQYESIRLFVDRAAAVQPSFRLSGRNGLAVAQICHRLDGIPLAIELAAARLRALSVDQIAARLDDRFNLLTVGSRTALPRHQTLRATIDWG